MSTQIKKNGNWVTVAGGTRMWVGTKAALQAALDAGELVDGTAVMVTDDYEEATSVKSGDVTLESSVSLDTYGWCKYYQSGHVVNINFHGVVPGGTAPKWFKVGQLPSTVKFPAHEILFLAESPSTAIIDFCVTTSGAICVWNPKATESYLAGNCTYIAE